MKHRLFSISLFLLVTLTCLTIIEVTLRYFVFIPWSEENIVNNPDHRMTHFSHNNINSDGIRSRQEASDYHGEDFNIIFLGDSFIYGWRLKMGQTIPAEFEKFAHATGYERVHAANFGWVSSSPYLSKRLLVDIGQKYKPDLVVLLLDMTDIFDDRLYQNIVEQKRFFAIGRFIPGITLLISKINQTLWQSDFLADTLFGVPARRYFIAEQPLESTRNSFDNTMKNIDDINSYCRESLGVPFALFIMPRHFQYDARLSPDNWEKKQYALLGPFALEPFRYFDEIAKKREYPVISLLPDLQHTNVFPTTFQDDPHLNEKGSLFTAEVMFRYLRAVYPALFPVSADAAK